MHNSKWLLGLVALIAIGLMAGCGGGDDSSTSSTSAEDSTSSTTTASSEGATPDDIYQACLDVVSDIPVEGAGDTACAQVRDGFEQCISQAADSEAATQACQDAADKTMDALKSAG